MNLDVLVADFDRVIVTAFDLVVNIEFCIIAASASILCAQPSRIAAGKKKRTPFSSFVILLSGTLDNVVAQDICNFNRMVDLHAGINSRATVLVEVLTSLLASSE